MGFYCSLSTMHAQVTWIPVHLFVFIWNVTRCMFCRTKNISNKSCRNEWNTQFLSDTRCWGTTLRTRQTVNCAYFLNLSNNTFFPFLERYFVRSSNIQPSVLWIQFLIGIVQFSYLLHSPSRWSDVQQRKLLIVQLKVALVWVCLGTVHRDMMLHLAVAPCHWGLLATRKLHSFHGACSGSKPRQFGLRHALTSLFPHDGYRAFCVESTPNCAGRSPRLILLRWIERKILIF